MSDGTHLKAPWIDAAKPSSVVGWPVVGVGGRLICNIAWQPKPEHVTPEQYDEFYRECQQIARLIAAAPDHAMIAAVLCTGVARWEAWDRGPKGEFCIEGFRHSTTLDEFGVPEMTHALRAAIDRALATEEAKR